MDNVVIIAGAFIAALGIPSAVTAFCFWCLEKKIEKTNTEHEKKEEAREKLQLLMIKSTTASIALGEATAEAVARIPDAHCNGDMHGALEYARKIKAEQRDFLAEQGVKGLQE